MYFHFDYYVRSIYLQKKKNGFNNVEKMDYIISWFSF